jgi:hypothetical protein
MFPALYFGAQGVIFRVGSGVSASIGLGIEAIEIEVQRDIGIVG